MPDSTVYQRALLGNVLRQQDVTLLRTLLSEVVADHFSGKWKVVFMLLERYFKMVGTVPTMHDLMDSVQAADNATPNLVLEYDEALLDLLQVEQYTVGEFSWAIIRLREQMAVDQYGSILADTMQTLSTGITVDGKRLMGLDAARSYYARETLQLDLISGTSTTAGDLHDERHSILDEYADAKSGVAAAYRVPTGIREMDQLTGGFAPTEMIFLAGYTGEGKTTLALNVAYAAMLQGRNVVYATTETLRSQIRRRLVVRHSLHPKFQAPTPLTLDTVKHGLLDNEHEQLFMDVVDDLSDSSVYGTMRIIQVPRRCTSDQFAAMLANAESEFYVHLAVWDELRLGGTRRRETRREELSDIIIDCKQIATTHRHRDGAQGLVILAPYQIARGNWETAVKYGKIDKSCMSETSEAEKTADLIWAILREGNKLKNFVLKYRDGGERGMFETEWLTEQACIKSTIFEADALLADI